MKSRRMVVVSGLLVAVMLVSSFFMFGCGEATPGEQKTLKIGATAFLGWPIGLDFSRGLEIMAELENEKGGLDIGGEKYNIEFIVYDSEMDVATETAAVNRLVYEDEVKFIVTDGTNVAAWLDITEDNEVLVFTGTVAPDILSPDLEYAFNGAPQNCAMIIAGWFADNFPDKKTMVQVLPDHQIGHLFGDINKAAYTVFGLDVTNEFYPPESQDLSAVGTKVKTLNPDILMAIAGGTALDGLVFKAAWQAGYRGQLFSACTAPAGSLLQVVPAEALEGYIGGAMPVEFDPPPTELAQEFKDAWIAKYGAWEGPEIFILSTWACLKEALQQAGSLDADEVADVISNGLKFEGPVGACQMVSRPDMGNNRTIDCVVAYYIKQVVNGEPVLIDTMSLDEAVGYFQQVYK